MNAWNAVFKAGILGLNDFVATLHNVGDAMRASIQLSISNMDYPANAPATIARKGKNTPLRDTLLLFRSISYEVVIGEGREWEGLVD